MSKKKNKNKSEFIKDDKKKDAYPAKKKQGKGKGK